MLLGVVVFGDVIHVTPWLLALQAVSVAAMITGVILVARAPVFRGLRLLHPQLAVGGSAEPPAGSDAVPQPPAAFGTSREATETSVPSA